MGDFNDIRSKELDQSKEESSRKQVLPLLRWKKTQNLMTYLERCTRVKKNTPGQIEHRIPE